MLTHSTINKVILAGRVDKEPRLHLKNGQRILNFSLVTTEKIRRNGAFEFLNEYHQVQVAEHIIGGELFAKGTPVCVQGCLQTSQFTDERAIKRYKTVIIANSVEQLSF